MSRSGRTIDQTGGGVKIYKKESFIQGFESCQDKKLHVAKEERVASENNNTRVTKDHKFDGGRFSQGKSFLWEKLMRF